MNVPISEAKAQLTDLVHRAEAGEEVILTRFGHAVARIQPIMAKMSPAETLTVPDPPQSRHTLNGTFITGPRLFRRYESSLEDWFAHSPPAAFQYRMPDTSRQMPFS